MSEIALVSAKKVRLEQLAADGDRGAKRALELGETPTRLLSTVQIGISLVTLGMGAFGETAFSPPVEALLAQFPLTAPYAKEASTLIVVLMIGFTSIIIGELVPKRIGQIYPETIARRVALPMSLLAKATAPIVHTMAVATDNLLRPFGKSSDDDAQVTEEDIKGLMRQGASAGVFEASESTIVSRVFNLDDYTVGRIMTPRADMVVIDVEADTAATLELLKQSDYTRYPVVKNDVSNVIGIIDTGDLLAYYLKSGKLIPERVRMEAIYVPETITLLEVLETFKRTRGSLAIVVDEHGEVRGLVTLKDVLEAIVGDLGDENEPANSDAVQRQDGTWLVDGAMTIDRFHELFPEAESFSGELKGAYRTLGGFVMAELGRIAAVSDVVAHTGYRFEVLDMDGKRVDKLLVTVPKAVNTDETGL